MKPRRYRKKPVVIEAMQFNGLDDYLRIVKWMKESGDTHALADEVRYSTPIMLLHTLEGTMAANPGAWIIRGVEGEFYVCSSDLFEANYEPVVLCSYTGCENPATTLYAGMPDCGKHEAAEVQP